MATPILYGHPFSSYTQKALIAFYEKDAPFEFRMLGPDQPETMAALTALWPLGKFPVLSEGPLTLVEASVIVEHVDRAHPGGEPLVPTDDPALEMRMLDRVFDNYVMTPTAKIVGDSLRPADGKDPAGVAEAEATLETIYGWLDGRLAGREWATGGGFHPGRLRRSAVPVLRRLGLSNRRALCEPVGLPGAAPGAALGGAGGGGSAALSRLFPPRRP